MYGSMACITPEVETNQRFLECINPQFRGVGTNIQALLEETDGNAPHKFMVHGTIFLLQKMIETNINDQNILA